MLSIDCSAETLQARREWHNKFKVMKGKNLQTRILYTAKLSFRIDGEIESFIVKQKLREFSTTRLANVNRISLGKINLRRNTRHKVIKIKDNDKILKATRENDK